MFGFAAAPSLVGVAPPVAALGERVAAGPLGSAAAPDLLRLLAVPVFAWAAYRDVKTRRVRNETWYPLLAVGVVALLWDAALALDGSAYEQRALLVRTAVSLGLVAPLGYVFWRIGGFGGADAKAVMVLALLFPATPLYLLRYPSVALPHQSTPLGVFSLTVLSNTVVLGVCYPVALALRNLARGTVGLPMVIGRPVTAERVIEEYGRLLESPAGYTRQGLDVDALRMYLQWRGATLAALRADPETHRDPASLPAERADPGDGSIHGSDPVADGGVGSAGIGSAVEGRDAATMDATADGLAAAGDAAASGEAPSDDPWGAALFLDEIDGTAYGTTPAALRDGLDVLVSRERVWITPGIPFFVPMFLGLVVALTFGDILFALLAALGAA